MVHSGNQHHVPLKVFHYTVLISLWIFVILHAFNMLITIDEAYSFFLVKTNYYRAMPGHANTHWLNSFFIKLFSLILGDSPGLIRLHSVLAFPFFAAGIFRLSAHISNTFLRLLFYCLILFNPYILDFFSLARGYGMALTFQVWMLIFFIKAASEKNFDYKSWLFSFVCSALSIASNLSYFYSVLGIAGFLAIRVFLIHDAAYSIKISPVKKIVFLYALLFLFTAGDLLFIKHSGHSLDFTLDLNLVLSLYGTVWKSSLYFAHYPGLQSVLTYTSFILSLIGIAYFLFRFVKDKKITAPFIILFPFLGVLLSNILFHLLFNNPYLHMRAALQWYVPGILLIVLLVGEIKMSRFLMPAVTGIACLLVVVHFFKQADIHYCFEWRANAESRNGLQDLYRLQAKHPAANIPFGVYRYYYSLVDSNLAKLQLSFHRELDDCNDKELKKPLPFDYIIALPYILNCLDKAGINYTVIRDYPLSSEKLIKLND